MYCKNCGNKLEDNAAVCVKCGFSKGSGTKYCQNCGQILTEGAGFCVSCGASVESFAQSGENSGEAKSKIAAGILGILLGGLGIHNFYLGYTKKGLIQLLLSVLSCGTLSWASAIWGLVEGILILTGSMNVDAAGNPLKD